MAKQFDVRIENLNGTIQFAAQELNRCLDMLQLEKHVDDMCSIELKVIKQPGLKEFDDWISIDVNKGNGIIAGGNPRSVLIAVYRYLKEIGCRFLFPGEEGEIFPKNIQIEHMNVKLCETPKYRYRGLCIEGANSSEMIAKIIDFLPKLGFNSYFIQFRQAYVFYKRWYRHTGNLFLESDVDFPVEEADNYVKMAEEEIQKRDLIYHAVGHGWTCDPFGIPGLSWDKWETPITEEQAENFALVNGVRALWDGVPLNTNLCFSNLKVRETVVNDICNYIQKNKTVDILHVWLSDGSNNQCECTGCTEKIPSDWYVLLLKEIDEALVQEDICTKIVFLIYSDLLWPPQAKKLYNTDRFILMFAPISRSYRGTFSTKEKGTIIPFIRNKVEMPSSVADNLEFLKAWQNFFKGDGFDFDYHYMWAHHKDPGGFAIAKVLYDDIQNLGDIGLNGYISCQVQRAMFPNALGITVMGEALWGGKSFEEIADDYFKNLYGECSTEVKEYLRDLSELCFSLNLEEKPALSQEKAMISMKLLNRIKIFRDSCNWEKVSTLHSASEYLCLHAKMWSMLSEALYLLYSGKKQESISKWRDVQRFMWDIEPRIWPVLDCFNFNRTFNDILGDNTLEYY